MNEKKSFTEGPFLIKVYELIIKIEDLKAVLIISFIKKIVTLNLHKYKHVSNPSSSPRAEQLQTVNFTKVHQGKNLFLTIIRFTHFLRITKPKF